MFFYAPQLSHLALKEFFFFFHCLYGDIIKGEIYEKLDNFRVFISNH